MMRGDIKQSGLATANPTWIGLSRPSGTTSAIADMIGWTNGDARSYSKFGSAVTST
jgi:hypothetical protein